MEQACQAVIEHPTEHNLVELLDLWSQHWKHKGRKRAIGAGSYDIYCTLGLSAFAGNAPDLSKASIAKEACVQLSHFLRDRFRVTGCHSEPSHRTASRQIDMPNHAIALGDFTQVWIQDDEETSLSWAAVAPTINSVSPKTVKPR